MLILSLVFLVAAQPFAQSTKTTALDNATGKGSDKFTLSGQVLCRDSNRPVKCGVTIVVDARNTIKTTSTENGTFTAQVPANKTMQIKLDATDYEPNVVTYSTPVIASEDADEVKIMMTPRYELVMDGVILDAHSGQPIPAKLDVYFDTDIVKKDVVVAEEGKYREVVTDPGWYIIDILSPGYVGVTDTLWLIHEGHRHIHRDYQLRPIEVGLNVVIKNVYFYFGQTSLKPESAQALERIIEFTKLNPTLVIEIAGHTDDEGAADYNMTLSQGRAEAITDYLIKAGIDPSRLVAKGYGETKPIDNTGTKEGKAKNRRVEFTVLSR